MERHFFRQAVAAGIHQTTASMPAAPIAWNVFGALLIAATAALIIFISTASYARKETASGSLISTAGIVRVSARNGGVVTELGISEGDRVEIGQTLFTINSQQGLESGGTLASALIASLDAQIRLINQQIDSEPKRIASEIVRLDAEIENVKAQREAIASQRALQAQLIATADERQRALTQLYQKGSATKVALQQQQGVHCASRQSLAGISTANSRRASASWSRCRRQREQLPVQQNERLSQLRLSLRGGSARGPRPRRAAHRSSGLRSTAASPRCKSTAGNRRSQSPVPDAGAGTRAAPGGTLRPQPRHRLRRRGSRCG